MDTLRDPFVPPSAHDPSLTFGYAVNAPLRVSLLLRGLLTTALLLFPLCSSGQFRWEKLNGPELGQVRSVAVTLHGYVLAGVTHGVARSTDKGTTWQIDSSLTTDGISALFADTGKYVYAGSSLNEIFRSSDEGRTWKPVDTLHRSPPWSGNSVHCFLRHSSGAMAAGVDGGVLASWDNFNTSSMINVTGSGVVALAEHPSGQVYAATPDGVQPLTIIAGTLSLSGPFRALRPDVIAVMAITESGAIVAGGNDPVARSADQGLYRTTDGGVQWTKVYSDLQLGPNHLIEQLIMSPWGSLLGLKGGEYLWGGSEGTSWSSGNFSGGKWHGSVTGSAIAYSPAGYAYLGGYGAIYRSLGDDAAFDQSLVSMEHATVSGIAVIADTIVATVIYGGGIYRSTDKGNSWSSGGYFGPDIPWLAVTRQGQLLAGDGGSGILRSRDRGRTWSALTLPPDLHGKPCLAVRGSGEILAGFQRNAGLLRSSDEGTSWSQDSSLKSSVTMIFAHPSGVVFSYCADGRLYRSANDSATAWEECVLPIGEISAMAADSSGYVFALNRTSGVFRSVDTGKTWTTLPFPLTASDYLGGIAVDARGALFVSSARQGTLASPDHGMTWQLLPGAPWFISSTTGEQDVLYFGTSGYGLFRGIESTTAVQGRPASPAGAPDREELLQNFPNPFNPATEITVQLKERGNLQVTVYDVLGREVTRLMEGAHEAGTYRLRFDGSLLPSGVYLCRLQTQRATYVRRMLLLR